MKKILLFFAIAFAIISCNTSNNSDNSPSFTITGQTNANSKGKVFLNKMKDGELVIVDTTSIENGTFSFKGKVELPELYFITFTKKTSYIRIFIENTDIKITVNPDSLDKSTVTGSASHTQYISYLEDVAAYQNKIKDLNKKYIEAQGNGDKVVGKQIDSTFRALIQERTKYFKKYVHENNKSAVAAYVAVNELSNDIEAPSLDSIINDFDAVLAKSLYIKQLKEKVEILRNIQIGQQVPDLTIKDTSNRPVSLTALRGKAVLIYFWAAWNKSTRAYNQDLLKLYKKFKDKDFEIIGISLDNVKKEWMKAIKADNLPWLQVSELKGWKSEAVKMYCVRNIPHTILVNKEGTIIEKNLSLENLEKKIKSICK